MNVIHGTVGDPWPMGATVTSEAKWCSCACQRCLDGDCCQFPPKDFTAAWPRTTVTPSTVPSFAATCGAIDHDYAVLDPARLYCRKCGTTRKV